LIIAKNVADYFSLREDTLDWVFALWKFAKFGVWLLTRSYFRGSSASMRGGLNYRLAEESLEFFTRECGDVRRHGRAFDLGILKFHGVLMYSYSSAEVSIIFSGFSDSANDLSIYAVMIRYRGCVTVRTMNAIFSVYFLVEISCIF